jgi:putative transposase
MARPRRLFVPGTCYHVINRGLNRAAIFTDDVDYEWFIFLLERAAAANDVSVHSFVLMDNHYHLMATAHSALALPRAMKVVGQRYGRYFNRKHHRIGSMWNGRYRAIPILDAVYSLTCLRYIEQNPVRARMVEDPADYRWSTYGIHAFGRPPGWIEAHHSYLALGNDPLQRQEAYRAICTTSVSAAERVRLGSDPNPTLV